MTHMTYSGVGVNYDLMDPFKRQAQLAARETARHLAAFGFSEVEWTRGESVYLIETPWGYLAHVEEGLGTKNIAADLLQKQVIAAELHRLRGKSFYDAIAQDTVAMIVNDMITLGAMPLSVAMHLAVGSGDWFANEHRVRELIQGWQHACDLAGCAWAGGETPTLKDVVMPETVVLSGSALGVITDKAKLIKPAIQEGDAIMLLASSGIHANGLTLARKIAERLPAGYLTELSDGSTYGESLLRPTTIYVPVVRGCLQAADVPFVHYTVNITGHGWRKLMRANDPFVYVLEQLPPPSSLFAFLQEQGPVTDEEAYGNLNMGVGFALFVPQDKVDLTVQLARTCGIEAWQGGHVELRGDEKKVIIVPKGLEYSAETLVIR